MASKRQRWSSEDLPESKRRRTKNVPKLIFDAFLPEPQLNRLPDNVTLLIMFYLDVFSLFRLARSCKRFYHLSRENELWIHVDMTTLPYMDVRKLKKLIKQHLPSNLESITIKSDYPNRGKLKKPKIDTGVLDTLVDQCPDIKSIELWNCDLTGVLKDCKLTRCASLESVSIIRSCTPLHWLSNVKWPLLRKLSLDKSTMTSFHELRAILESNDWQNSLECLDLTGCFRCNDFIDTGKNPLKCLKKLILSSTKITVDSFESIAKLPALEELYLGDLTFSDEGLRKVPVLFPNLKVLDLTDVHNVSKLVLEQIKNKMPWANVIF